MKKACSSILIVCLGILFFNCEDVFEENISDDLITLVFPRGSEKITGNSVAFKWNALDGAEHYRLQVLRSNTQELLIDSLFSNSNLILPLSTGEYDWRVRGENFAYETAYSFPEKFSIESTGDLASQNVFLNSPSDNFYTKDNTIILNWSELGSATSYVLQVAKTVANNSSIVLQEIDIVTNGYALDNTVLSEDAIYNWGVRAVNDNSQTGFASRNIFLDTTTPNRPVLTSPNNEDTASSPVDFSWNIGLDFGEVQSPIKSVLEIASDEKFASLVQSYTTTNATQTHSFDTIGTHYWRLKLIDEAGNESEYSESRLLTIE